MSLGFFTLTGHLTAVTVDYVDAGVDPDLQAVSCTVDFLPRIPTGDLVWASGLTPKQGLALAPFRARFDTDGVLRTIAANGAQNETQIVSTTLVSGTFPLTWQGQTATIAYNATSLTVQNALAALPNIGVGNISVGGATGGPWTVAFTGVYAATDVPSLSTTNPNVTITPGRTGSLNAGVRLIANTAAINLDQLIYDCVFSNVIFNKADQDIFPRAFVAPATADITVDMADLEWIAPKAGL